MPLRAVIELALSNVGEGLPPTLLDDHPNVWGELLECAAKLQTVPLLTHTADTLPLWLARLAADRHMDSEREARVRRNVAQLLADVCAANAIPIAFRKGVHTASLYPDAGCRPTGDIDVLVSPDSVRDMLAAAKSVGLADASLSRAQRAWILLATNSRPPLEYVLDATGDVVSVDVATSLDLPAMKRPPDQDRVERMLSRAIVSEDGLPVLSIPDAFVDSVINMYIVQTSLRYVWRLRFQRLTYFLDLLVMGRRLTHEGLAAVAAEVKDDPTRDAFAFALGNLARLAPRSPTSRRLSVLIPEGREHVMDEIGQWELDRPYRWRETLEARLVLDAVPGDLPAARAPL